MADSLVRTFRLAGAAAVAQVGDDFVSHDALLDMTESRCCEPVLRGFKKRLPLRAGNARIDAVHNNGNVGELGLF